MPNPADPPKARNAKEVALEAAMVDVVRGLKADERRKKLMLELSMAGMTQAELAARLTRAALKVGGEPVSENSVQKILTRCRAAAEREMREAMEQLEADDPANTTAGA